MKKNPIPVLIPVVAIIIALMLLKYFGGSPDTLDVYSIENEGGSYFLIGNRNKVESVKLSDGKELTWDKQSGELVYCKTEDGINRITVTWAAGEALSDTVISTDNNMQQIVLDHSLIQSNMNFECPLEPLEVGDFIVSGPDGDCKYRIIIRSTFQDKGYQENDIKVSWTGENGNYSDLKSWKAENRSTMEIWIKVKGQNLMITPNRKYLPCIKCNQKRKDTLIKNLRKDLLRYIETYDYQDQLKLENNRNLIVLKSDSLIDLNTFFQDVEVNGFNRDLGASDAIKINSIVMEGNQCSTFKISYEYEIK